MIKGKGKKLSIGLVLCAILLTGSGQSIKTWTVCSSGCDKTTIGAAINAAGQGDTIEVHSGKYLESVLVNKRLILQGKDTGSGMPIVDAQDSGTAIN